MKGSLANFSILPSPLQKCSQTRFSPNRLVHAHHFSLFAPGVLSMILQTRKFQFYWTHLQPKNLPASSHSSLFSSFIKIGKLFSPSTLFQFGFTSSNPYPFQKCHPQFFITTRTRPFFPSFPAPDFTAIQKHVTPVSSTSSFRGYCFFTVSISKDWSKSALYIQQYHKHEL